MQRSGLRYGIERPGRMSQHGQAVCSVNCIQYPLRILLFPVNFRLMRATQTQNMIYARRAVRATHVIFRASQDAQTA